MSVTTITSSVLKEGAESLSQYHYVEVMLVSQVLAKGSFQMLGLPLDNFCEDDFSWPSAGVLNETPDIKVLCMSARILLLWH
jgi:hypothetical protein